MPKKTQTYRTLKQKAELLGISHQRMSQLQRTPGWRHPSGAWSEADAQAVLAEMHRRRAEAPNQIQAAPDVADESTSQKLKNAYLLRRIQRLDLEMGEMKKTLVPAKNVEDARAGAITIFIGWCNGLQARAYDLVGLDKAGIASRIREWRDELFDALHGTER